MKTYNNPYANRIFIMAYANTQNYANIVLSLILV